MLRPSPYGGTTAVALIPLDAASSTKARRRSPRAVARRRPARHGRCPAVTATGPRRGGATRDSGASRAGAGSAAAGSNGRPAAVRHRRRASGHGAGSPGTRALRPPAERYRTPRRRRSPARRLARGQRAGRPTRTPGRRGSSGYDRPRRPAATAPGDQPQRRRAPELQRRHQRHRHARAGPGLGRRGATGTRRAARTARRGRGARGDRRAGQAGRSTPPATAVRRLHTRSGARNRAAGPAGRRAYQQSYPDLRRRTGDGCPQADAPGSRLPGQHSLPGRVSGSTA